MKKLLFILALSGVFAALAVEVDGIAANVGASSILKSDVYDEMRKRGVTDEARFGEFRNSLIERELILKAAAAAKMTMQDWVVEDRIRVIVEDSFGGDRTALDEMLTSRRISEADWKKRIKDDMIVNAMRWTIVDKNVMASPAMMKAEYEKHPERYRRGKRVSISVILLSP
ncbi:MAG: SurA N-terminal domain-containing protein, partial [Kiritimatiellae bacterium]|nr:SurA N-terminal domain-containing protein [Kiritimatiellia bacterium]